MGVSKGDYIMVQININKEKCDGCRTCVDTCPVGVYDMREGKSVALNTNECLVCKACEMQCPNGAIEIVE